MSNKDDAPGTFLFVNKSTTSRTLSRSKAKEKAKIFRHVQQVRQKQDGQRQRQGQAARLDVPIEPYETCWALSDGREGGKSGEQEGSRRAENSIAGDTASEAALDDRQGATRQSSFAETELARGGGHAGPVTKWQTPAIERPTGDALDPFDSFPQMAQYLPATEHYPQPIVQARSLLLSYLQGLDLTDFARKERLLNALTRPTVMFSHLVLVVMDQEFANEQLGRKLDRVFGVSALRHVRREIGNLGDRCPWDLICLVNIFMIRAQVLGRSDIARAHRGGLIAMIERNGGMAELAASNHMAQAGVNGLVLCELLISTITGEPLHPVLGDVTASGNFSKHSKDKAPVSPLNCLDGDFSELASSPHSRPETIKLLHSTWLLVHSVTPPSGNLKLRRDAACSYSRAREAILASFEIASPQDTADFIYECCHLTALLLLNAAEAHVPIHACLANFPIAAQIKQLVQCRESSNSWGAFKGVYLNVVLLAYLASLATSSRAYFHARVSHSVGYYVCGAWDGVYRPLMTLKQFQDFCRSDSDLLCA